MGQVSAAGTWVPPGFTFSTTQDTTHRKISSSIVIAGVSNRSNEQLAGWNPPWRCSWTSSVRNNCGCKVLFRFLSPAQHSCWLTQGYAEQAFHSRHLL